RPGDRNRITHEMAGALVEACEEAEDSDAVAVVTRGSREWFCGGLADGVTPQDLWGRRNPIEALARITKPVIAVLNGSAVGPGAELALAADLRVAAETAALVFPDVAEGRLPCFGATQRLPRLIGRARALEVLLLGTPIGALEAQRLGLVTRIAPAVDLGTAIDDLIGMLRAQGPLALVLAKEAVRRAGDLPLADGMRLEEDLYALLLTTADRAEGVSSFVEKRGPRFGGR
ncbi:MAG: enoyl-CoA hydratase/isomerase family protein, partial [Planctomycetota bacterium]